MSMEIIHLIHMQVTISSKEKRAKARFYDFSNGETVDSVATSPLFFHGLDRQAYAT